MFFHTYSHLCIEKQAEHDFPNSASHLGSRRAILPHLIAETFHIMG